MNSKLLKKGDKVGIISPSSAINKGDIDEAIEYLKNLGFEPVVGKNVYNKYRWMAGTEAERAEDINACFQDKDIKAIFCSRGGAGCQKILPLIDYEMVKRNHKLFFGLSDTTALQLALYEKSDLVSYSGFLLRYDFNNGKIDEMTEQSLCNVISGQQYKIKDGETVVGGKTEGILIGGCLSLVRNIIGTEFMPSWENCILFLEDVDEKLYKIDLMLEQIKQNKDFCKLKGIVFGKFADCHDDEDTTIYEVISLFCKDLKIPVIKDFPYGHIKSRHILPIGQKVIFDADKCEITVLY